MLKKYFLALIVVFFVFECHAQQQDWRTYYEASGMKATPRYAETMRYLERLDSVSAAMSTGSFGKSAQGRDLRYVVYDIDGFNMPAQIRKAGRAILLVQACIHPGESEGKDAMLMLLRDQVINHAYDSLFAQVSLVFIPIFNVDGHERFGAYNRINQNGPIEMGWRTTAQNLNLNRDYLKAETPEMQAWLSLFNTWNPDFFVDTHTTDGADYQYVVTYAMEISGNMEQGLTEWQKNAFIPSWEKQMRQAGFPVFPYVSFRQWHDPLSGLVSWVGSPMLSQGYTALRNRPGLLLETHMLKPYQQRVEATKEAVLLTLKILNEQKNQLKKAINQADEFTASKAFREQSFTTKYTIDMTDSVMVAFDGVAYKHEKSDLTGGELFTYDNSQPETFDLALFDKVLPEKQIQLPEAYVIPVEWTRAIEKVKLHGIRFFELTDTLTIHVQCYRFTNIDWNKNPYEGRHQVSKYAYTMEEKQVTYQAGSIVVPTGQALARVLAHLLEPDGDGSLLEWGFFDAVFEQKEYAESYVLEPLARQMLDSIPALREQFEAKLAEDPGFAKSSWAQLNWFYSLTPWWDQKFMIYPVGRITKKAVYKEVLMKQPVR